MQSIVIVQISRVFAPQYSPQCRGAFGVYLKAIGIVDVHDFSTPRPSISIDGFLYQGKKGEIMKRTLLFTAIVSVLTTSAFASNIVTSKTYVDNRDALKVDIAQGVGTNNANVGKTLVVNQQGNLELGTVSADNFVEDSITDGVTNKAPSENAVHDALEDKQDTIDTGMVEEWGYTMPSLVTYDSTDGGLTGTKYGILRQSDLDSDDTLLTDCTDSECGIMIPTAQAVASDLASRQEKQIGAARVGNANSTDAGKVLVVGNDGKITMGTTMPDTSNFQTKIPATEWHDVYDTPIPGVVISTNTDGEVEQRMILDKTQNISDESIDRLVSLGYDDGRQDNSVLDDIHDNSVSSTDINYAVPTTTMTVAIANAAANTKQAKKTCAGWLDGTTVADATHTDANCVLWNLPD